MLQTTLLNDQNELEESMIETLHELAAEMHLPELHWEFLHEHGETIVEGHPSRPTDFSVCERWAKFLNMQAVGSVEQDAVCRWLGMNGHWTLEIVAEVA